MAKRKAGPPGKKKGASMSATERHYLTLDKIMTRYGDKPGGLMRVLTKAQELFGYLSKDVQIYIAEKMCLPIGHVNGVATFYSQFVTSPRGKYTISVCLGTACYVKNAQDIYNKFSELLGIGEDETTADRLFTLRATRCIGACSLAPLVTINDDVHGHLAVEDVAGLINRYQEAEREREADEIDTEPVRPAGPQAEAPPPH